MKDKRGEFITLLIFTAVLCTVQILFFMNSDSSVFCFAAAVFVSSAYIFTLSLCKKYIAACCAGALLLLGAVFFSPFTGLVFAAVCAVSMFGSVGTVYLLAEKAKFGTLLSAVAAFCVSYAALRFGERLLGGYFKGDYAGDARALFSYTVFYAVLAAAAIAVLAAPAVNVLTRKTDTESDESGDNGDSE